MDLTHEEASEIVAGSDIGPYCHGDLEGVRKAMEAEPQLAAALSALDYRREDEIPQHAAAHSGATDVVEYMVSQGVTLDIFMACALGDLEAVGRHLEADPQLAHARGAHGIGILNHAATTEVSDAIIKCREQHMDAENSYLDYKGRIRWHRNDEVAHALKVVADLLLISGSDAKLASRCGRAYHEISRHPTRIDEVFAAHTMTRTFGLAKAVTAMIEEYLESGVISKRTELEKLVPATVVELCDIPKVGGKTARMLYEVHGIDGLQALQQALDDGTLDGVKGMGKKTLETMRKHIEKVEAERAGEKSPGR